MTQVVAIFKPHLAKTTACLSRWLRAENSSHVQESKILSVLCLWAKTLILDMILTVYL